MDPTDTKWPFEFKRVQFLVQLCFAMTINKSQGQSLNKVELYLPQSVFTHGQLYIVVSRVTSPSSLHIMVDSDHGGSTNVTANVVFEELFGVMAMYTHLAELNDNRNDWTVKFCNLESVDGVINTGGCYVISNFQVSAATGVLRSVRSINVMTFIPATVVVVPDPHDDGTIPDQEYELIPLYQLKDNPIHSAKATVWANLAVVMEAHYNEISKDEPIIVILTTTKLKIFHTSVQISTVPASKIYLNLDFDVVHEMRQRLREEGYVPSDIPMSSTSLSEVSHTPLIKTITLKEFSEKTVIIYLKMNFLCKVKVKNVEENNGWWYLSCSKNVCFGEVTKLEAFNLVLLDRAAKRLAGKTATKLTAEGFADPATYPPHIKGFVGKEITVKIELNDDNILLNSTVFYATDAYDSDSASSSTSASTLNKTDILKCGDTHVVEISDNGYSPGSAKSSSKKIKVEK
ncbi:uncharacterized protein LOC141719979 [Apium graveolens]|uniref:uncharacterized protein LOC141719979 n=1 Tax=Apium graveolens TaxID=4045 RepID=UPI003D78FFD4